MKRFLGCLAGMAAIASMVSCSDGTGSDDELDGYTEITRMREEKDSMFYRAVTQIENIQLLDYRTNEEFRKGHIPGATNIYGNLDVNANDLKSPFCDEVAKTFDKDYILFFYGSNQVLLREGHTLPAYGASLGWGRSAYHFDLGYEGWVAAGRPVCSDSACEKKCLHGIVVK